MFGQVLFGAENDWEEHERFVEDLLRQYPEAILPEDNQREKRSRKRAERPDYWASVWGKMLNDPDIEQPRSAVVARKFRRRFRVPYPLLKDVILPQCIDHNVFEMKRAPTIPIVFKLLIALRVMGRDAVADDCNELSFVGESTCHSIFNHSSSAKTTIQCLMVSQPDPRGAHLAALRSDHSCCLHRPGRRRLGVNTYVTVTHHHYSHYSRQTLQASVMLCWFNN